MALNYKHDSLDDIPEQYRDLYTEQNGAFLLTGIGGIKTQDDIDRLSTSLNKEREDHKATKTKFSVWGDLDYQDTMGKLDRFKELEIAASGNKEEMDARLEELTEARVGSRLAPVQRQLDDITGKYTEAQTELEALRLERTQRFISDDLRKACTALKVIPEAQDDVMLLGLQVFEIVDGKAMTKENPFGITPGLAADVWLQDMQSKRPHWWPTSTGGGASGSGGSGGFANNPWSKEHWNLTEQAKLVMQDEAKAEQMAKAAGSFIGATKPKT